MVFYFHLSKIGISAYPEKDYAFVTRNMSVTNGTKMDTEI